VTSKSARNRQTPPRLRFSLAPEPSRLLRARERIRDYLTAHCSDETTVNDIVLAIEEAATNAIRHSGSPEDIEIRLSAEDDQLKATVKDRGRGFDIDGFDPHLLPAPLLDHGRGLYLISRLSDELELRCDGGLEVHLTKHAVVETAAPAQPLDAGLTPAGATSSRPHRMRTMLEEIGEGYAALDWEYRHTHLNRAAYELLDLTSEQMLGHTPFELWPKLQGTSLGEAYRAAMELGVPSIVEHETTTHDWLEVRLYPTSTGVSVYFRDINQRKRKELEREVLVAALSESRDFLDGVLGSITDGFVTVDEHWRLTFANATVATTCGLSPAQLLGKKLREVLPGFARTEAEKALQRAMAERVTAEYDSYNAVQQRYSHGTIYPLAGGGLAALVRDTSHERRIEAALQASEDRYRTIVEASTEGIVVGSPEGTIQFVNPRMAEMLGYTVDELVGMSGADITAKDSQGERASARGVLHTGGPLRREIKLRRKDGSALWSWYSARPLFDAHGEHVANLTMHSDVSERKQAEEALRASEARYRSIVELATEQLASQADGSLSFDSEAGGDAAEQAAPPVVHRRRQRLLEAILAQRRHPFRTLLLALACELAYLVPLGLGPTRSILGMPGSLLALTVIVVGAIAGTRPGVVSALGGMAIFYFTVARRGVHASPLAVVISAGIWIAAAVLASALANALIEQSARRREAAVAFVQAETARREQSAELRNAQRIATTLQEVFLHPLPAIADLELGAVSRPAFAPELVGGDFNDVFVLDDGQVAVLIGDVAGKGVEAAGLTETVRSAVHAFATVDPSPAYVLSETNELLLRHSPDGQHVTAFYCLLDPRTGRLAYASAGHPAPIHLGPQLCRPLAVHFRPPLGSFEGDYEGAHTTLTLDDYLVLYTDGVTEARRRGEMYGESRLVENLVSLRGQSAQELAESLVNDVGSYADRLADDINVVALRLA
jgi:PAS domain S-box-containing protein